MSPRVHLDPLGRLVLTPPGGAPVAGVTPVRCFPFSAPSERISFLDAEGRELFCLESLDRLLPEERALVERELARREFIPVVRRIRSISPGAEPTIWQVETDRGEARFTLPSEDNVRRLGEHGALVADAHGVRYRVPDLRRLDAHSPRLLARYI